MISCATPIYLFIISLKSKMSKAQGSQKYKRDKREGSESRLGLKQRKIKWKSTPKNKTRERKIKQFGQPVAKIPKAAKYFSSL